MPTTTQDIWAYAKNAVEHKGVLTRVAHAKRFDPIRSAINSKGSLGSKLLKLGGSVARVGLNLIPIPALGSYLSSIEQDVESRIRKWHHEKKAGDSSAPDYVKFQLKEASLEDMDRYRRKVEEAAHEVNAALSKFNQAMSLDVSNTCDRFTDVALKIAQAERRLKIFDEEAMQIEILMKACTQWSAQFHKSVAKAKLELSEQLKDQVEIEMAERRRVALQGLASFNPNAKNPTISIQTTSADIDRYHAHCGDFCINRNNALKETNVHLERVIKGIKFMTNPITAEGALAYTRSSFAVTSADDYKKAYIGE